MKEKTLETIKIAVLLILIAFLLIALYYGLIQLITRS